MGKKPKILSEKKLSMKPFQLCGVVLDTQRPETERHTHHTSHHATTTPTTPTTETRETIHHTAPTSRLETRDPLILPGTTDHNNNNTVPQPWQHRY